jgi:hypothetical protein
MTYRVTQEFKRSGEPLTQPASDRLLERLRAAAPEADATLELGLGRFQLGESGPEHRNSSASQLLTS